MPIYLTPEGKQKLEKELEELISRRPLIAKRIERAKELGDLKENAEYHDAKDDQGMTESRIREIQSTLIQAHVVEKQKNSDTISIGSVFVAENANGKEKTYTIVGANEANPLEGKISPDSPLGRAFIGHKKGDTVEAEIPAGKIVFTVKEIS